MISGDVNFKGVFCHQGLGRSCLAQGQRCWMIFEDRSHCHIRLVYETNLLRVYPNTRSNKEMKLKSLHPVKLLKKNNLSLKSAFKFQFSSLTFCITNPLLSIRIDLFQHAENKNESISL